MFLMLWLMLQLMLQLLLPFVLADPPPFHRSHAYENGSLGIYPELSFRSSSLKAPQLNLVEWRPGCQSKDEYLFIAPRGLLVGQPGPIILDTRGHMVWKRSDFGVAYNFDVQQYMGEDVLTFWSGDDMVTGHGKGHYYMFDSSYRLLHKITALNNLTADLHEFQITANNTALITAYVPKAYDLSHYNLAFFTTSTPENPQTFIFDCIFQEIDIASQRLLFEWRSSDHFRPEDSFHKPSGTAGSRVNPFDYFHINSIDKDANGDYLVSARYTKAVTKISGTTGAVIWNLGGKNNSFSDIGLARHNASKIEQGFSFAWQHHARWHDNYTAITIFDNAAYFDNKTLPARGVSIAADQQAMTARLVTEWLHPDLLISESQGSLQMLANGNAFVGYGSAAAFTEFDANGRVLCDAHFAALYSQHNAFFPGTVMSYRAYKKRWRGLPVEEPHVKFDLGNLFVSWNGATEVRQWKLESRAGYGAGSSWHEVGSTAWQGFESSIAVAEGGAIVDGRQSIHSNKHAVYRLSALGEIPQRSLSQGRWWRERPAERTILGMWEVQTDNTVRRTSDTSSDVMDERISLPELSKLRGIAVDIAPLLGMTATMVGFMMLLVLRRRDFIVCVAGCCVWFSPWYLISKVLLWISGVGRGRRSLTAAEAGESMSLMKAE